MTAQNAEHLATAMAFATRAHAGQVRKGTSIPYISHPIAVSALVMEAGGSQAQAIAALLHDVVEDCGITPQRIEAQFGADVARMVMDCTDATTQPKPPWRQRKEAYLAALPHKRADSLLVSACDKLHNLRSIVADVERDGAASLQRFNGKVEGTLWYYESVVAVYAKAGLNTHTPPVPWALQDALASELERLNALLAAELA